MESVLELLLQASDGPQSWLLQLRVHIRLIGAGINRWWRIGNHHDSHIGIARQLAIGGCQLKHTGAVSAESHRRNRLVGIAKGDCSWAVRPAPRNVKIIAKQTVIRNSSCQLRRSGWSFDWVLHIPVAIGWSR